MTELGYLTDIEAGYTTRFRGRVVARPAGGLVLDRTFFYPTGGGQPADRGTLTDPDGHRVAVIDVRRVGSTVVHQIEGEPAALAALPVGTTVDGEIDWPRRHRFMRLHTAQHLLSARTFHLTGRRTERARLDDLGATIDLDGPIDEDALRRVRDDVQEVLRRPAAVRAETWDRAVWAARPAGRSGLVPLPANLDRLRVVVIEGWDECPCGGTHVRSTAEIGPVEVVPASDRALGIRRLQLRLGGGS